MQADPVQDPTARAQNQCTRAETIRTDVVGADRLAAAGIKPALPVCDWQPSAAWRN